MGHGHGHGHVERRDGEIRAMSHLLYDAGYGSDLQVSHWERDQGQGVQSNARHENDTDD